MKTRRKVDESIREVRSIQRLGHRYQTEDICKKTHEKTLENIGQKIQDERVYQKEYIWEQMCDIGWLQEKSYRLDYEAEV